MNNDRLRQSAEDIYADELKALSHRDDRPRPANWRSPTSWAARQPMGRTSAPSTWATGG